MVHPILTRRLYVIIYFAFWLLIAFGHFMANYKVFQAELSVALIDSLVFNVQFSFLGLALWYSVKFSQMEKYSTSSLILQHLAIATITIFFWTSTGYYSETIIPVIGPKFEALFEKSLIWKVINGLLYYSMITLIYYVIIYYNNFKEKLVLETELKGHVQKAELDVLRSQINPHFLFNSLNSISALTLVEPSKAREMVSQLSDFLRYTIKQSGDQMIVFEKEIDVVSSYLAIEKVRFSDRMEIEEDLDDTCLGKKLPNMILQPLVENAVKYGVAQNTGKSRVIIRATCFQGFLKVMVENNYDTEAELKKGTGIGLQNISQRLQLIYGRSDLMQISNKDGIFRVTITFPQIDAN